MHASESDSVVALGASTGGVEAIETFLRSWPPNASPVLIVQHMPATFIEQFVDRLGRNLDHNVQLAYSGQELQNGNVYIAPGGKFHFGVRYLRGRRQACLTEKPFVSGHRPSVDVLFSSLRDIAPNVVAVLLTGMGRDGAQGMAELRAAGAWTITQDKATCVVFGMPSAAIQMGASCETLPLEKIAMATFAATQRASERSNHSPMRQSII